MTGGCVVPAPLGRHCAGAMKALDIVTLRFATERDEDSTQRANAYDDR
jgi:hypothetical protein